VNFAVGGTAALNTDYTLTSSAPGFTVSAAGGSLQCSPSTPSAILIMAPLRDLVNGEGTENVTLSIVDPAAPKAYWLDTLTPFAVTSASANIQDVYVEVRASRAPTDNTMRLSYLHI
jgi:hypothetical protein